MGPDVDNRLTASSMYAHGWSTPEYDRMFEQKHRLQAWLNILVALAQAQAELGKPILLQQEQRLLSLPCQLSGSQCFAAGI